MSDNPNDEIMDIPFISSSPPFNDGNDDNNEMEGVENELMEILTVKAEAFFDEDEDFDDSEHPYINIHSLPFFDNDDDNTDTANNEISKSKHIKAQHINEADVADDMMHNIPFAYWNRQLWTFKDVAYSVLDDNVLIAMMKDIVSTELKEQNIQFWKRVIAHIKTTSSIQKDLDAVEHPVEEVVFENGIYDVIIGKFREATPEDYITTYNHITFDKSKADKKETTKQFFDFISDGDEELRALLWEVLGAILSHTSRYKKFFLLFGPTDTGKSLYGSLAEHLVGLNNCSHIALERLGDKYSAARLYGKMLNSSLDNSAVELKNLGVLKRLTSGGKDYIEAEGKYDGFYKIRPDRIKLLFASNSLPRISLKEDSSSIRNRMLIIPFLNQVPKNQQDSDLLEKLLEEKDYIIKKAMKAYRRLIENNFEFTQCSLADEMLDITFKHISQKDSVDEFVKSDYISIEPQEYVRGNDLYTAYKSFCADNGFMPIKEKPFIHQVSLYSFVERDRIDTFDGYIRILRGLKLN